MVLLVEDVIEECWEYKSGDKKILSPIYCTDSQSFVFSIVVGKNHRVISSDLKIYTTSEAAPAIPLTLQSNIESWSSNDIGTFLKVNNDEYQLTAVPSEKRKSMTELCFGQVEEAGFRDYGIPDRSATCIITEFKKENKPTK